LSRRRPSSSRNEGVFVPTDQWSFLSAIEAEPFYEGRPSPAPTPTRKRGLGAHPSPQSDEGCKAIAVPFG
jgi:hypothetical protein